MKNNNNINTNYTPKQLKFPLGIEKKIDINDKLYSFCDIVDCIDLTKYIAVKGSKFGRPNYSITKLLKVILFAYMENGECSLREIEKFCKNDIRYMWILDDTPAPSFATIGNFIKNYLTDGAIEKILEQINGVIFQKDNVDLEHTYIDGTKIEANANKYTWVWKKSCITNRNKIFKKVSKLIENVNEDIKYLGVKFETREEYAIEYLEDLLNKYVDLLSIDVSKFVFGIGKRKSLTQKRYEEFKEYILRLKKYSNQIKTCGEKRGSYSKTDNDATFMRIKRDYMGNDQLLPAYNVQVAVCDEYIAVIDVKQYASDTDCFVPLMEKFNKIYERYPKYPVADAGYGSLNNYIYCQEHGMEKYMKFTMFEKETKDEKYKDNPYRAVNFKQDEEGNIICPKGRKFFLKDVRKIKGNNYGRTEEVYECENCKECEHKQNCCPRAKNNRTIKVNRELTSMHKEVIENLCSIHGAWLCMNRSIQAEGTFGNIKWNKSYKRCKRKGLDNVLLELTLVACGYNLNKYYHKTHRVQKCA